MPSYRVELEVGALRAGFPPARLLPVAEAAAADIADAESSAVRVVRGVPLASVRFACDDAELARQVGAHVASVVAEHAEVLHWRVAAVRVRVR